MRRSTDHILASHAGSLPRPEALIRAWAADDRGALAETLRTAVSDVVRHQKELVIDVPGDGEFGKPMGQRVNYGSWWRYSWQRLSGIEPGGQTLYEMEPRRSRPGEIVLTSFGRPARPDIVRDRLQRPGVRDHNRSPPAEPDLHRPASLQRPGFDRGRYRPISSQPWRRPASRRVL